MSRASLRRLRVGVYAYSSTVDEATGVATSVYTKRVSPDADGLWWAAFGTVFGRERAPTGNPQDEQQAMFTVHGEVTLTADDVIVVQPSLVYRVQSVMPRNIFLPQQQAFASRVDDADPFFNLVAA